MSGKKGGEERVRAHVCVRLCDICVIYTYICIYKRKIKL